MAGKNAIVIGAGVAGTMTALALAKRGIKTRLIDRWQPGHPRASSSGYSRTIRSISGADEIYTQWAYEARDRWLELQAECGQRLYYESGALILATAGHCNWEDATINTYEKVGVPFFRFSRHEVAVRFPQFDSSDISYALYEPRAGILMAQRAVLASVALFESVGGIVERGHVTTNEDEKLLLDGKPLQADLIVVATGAWMGDMFRRTIKPIVSVAGISVFFTSTPDGSTRFDHDNMPCWIDHGQGSFGLPSVEASGVKASVVIPDDVRDLDQDARLVRREALGRTHSYIRTRLPDLVGEPVVDSKYNQITMTPDTHFIIDWHPKHENVLLAGGGSGHLFKHGPVFGNFVAGVGMGDYGTSDRFKIAGRRSLGPGESPTGR